MSSSEKKPMSRAQRNLAAANASRQRKKLHKASLVEEKSYFSERNAILRQQIELLPTVGGVYSPGPSSSSSRSCNPEMLQLSDEMAKLFGRKEIPAAGAVDLLDRVLSGSKGKAPAKDPELVRLWAQAQRAAPKNPKTAVRAQSRSTPVPPVRSSVSKPSGVGKSGASSSKKPTRGAAGSSKRS